MPDETKIELQAKVFQRDDGTFGFMTRLVTPGVTLVVPGFPGEPAYENPWQEYPGAVFENAVQAEGAMRLYVQMTGQAMQRDLEAMLLRLRSLIGGIQPGTPIYRIED